MSEPIGIRLNNPGNLRPLPDGQLWQGQTGTVSGFCAFDTPANGLRALAKNLINQQRLHGLRTVRAIITKFAPPSENDTGAYIADVSAKLCVSPDDEIDLLNPSTLELLMGTVIHHEQGQVPYSSADILTACVTARGFAEG